LYCTSCAHRFVIVSLFLCIFVMFAVFTASFAGALNGVFWAGISVQCTVLGSIQSSSVSVMRV